MCIGQGEWETIVIDENGWLFDLFVVELNRCRRRRRRRRCLKKPKPIEIIINISLFVCWSQASMPLTLFSISRPTRAFHLMPTRADVCLVSAVLVLNVFSYSNLFAPFPSFAIQWITISLFFTPSLSPPSLAHTLSLALFLSLALALSMHMFHFICFVQHKIQSLLWHCTSLSFSMMSVVGSNENGREQFSFRNRISFCRIGQNTHREKFQQWKKKKKRFQPARTHND